jgi:hypothetical protein
LYDNWTKSSRIFSRACFFTACLCGFSNSTNVLRRESSFFSHSYLFFSSSSYSANTRTISYRIRGPAPGPNKTQPSQVAFSREAGVECFKSKGMVDLPVVEFRNFVGGDTGWRDGRMIMKSTPYSIIITRGGGVSKSGSND